MFKKFYDVFYEFGHFWFLDYIIRFKKVLLTWKHRLYFFSTYTYVN